MHRSMTQGLYPWIQFPIIVTDMWPRPVPSVLSWCDNDRAGHGIDNFCDRIHCKRGNNSYDVVSFCRNTTTTGSRHHNRSVRWLRNTRWWQSNSVFDVAVWPA